MSEHDFIEECEHPETNLALIDDNSNDENDVDDETMSGKKIKYKFNDFLRILKI